MHEFLFMFTEKSHKPKHKTSCIELNESIYKLHFEEESTHMIPIHNYLKRYYLFFKIYLYRHIRYIYMSI